MPEASHGIRRKSPLEPAVYSKYRLSSYFRAVTAQAPRQKVPGRIFLTRPVGNTHVTIVSLIEVREYITEAGKSPFGKWFAGLNGTAAAKVTIALERVARGNLSNAKAVGGGVSEYKIDFGPGYRVYFGQDGATLVILLCGGSKKGQSEDIENAREKWADYKKRKREEAKRER